MTRYALALIPLLLSPADSARDRTYTLRGEGYLDPAGPGHRVPVREVRLRLREDGGFVATIEARGERSDVRGTWHRSAKGPVDRLEIGDAFGQRADGDGSLQFIHRDDDHPIRLFLEGRTRQGGFRLDVRAENARAGDDWEDENSERVDLGRGDRLSRGIDATTSGEGILRMSGVRDGRFTVMRARLGTSRDAHIDIDRTTRGTIRGDVANVRGNIITVRVRQIMGRDASGEIEFTMRSEHEIERVRGSGTSTNGSWQLDFDGPNGRRRRGDDDVKDVGGWGRDRWPLLGRSTFESSQRGSGVLTQDIGPSITFDRMRITLPRGRNAILVLEGRGQSVRFEGPWTQERGDDLTVDLRQVNEMRARGRVDLRLSRGTLESARGDGHTERGRFDLRFTRR